MRRSLAPSQQLHNVVTKKPRYLPPTGVVEKENDECMGNADATSTLQETLKSIRKPNVRSDDCERTTGVAGGKSMSLPSRDTSVLNSQSDNNTSHLTSLRNEIHATTRLEHNVVKQPDTKITDTEDASTAPCKLKVIPPKKFISPILAVQSKNTTINNASHNGEPFGNADNITSHYYSVVW